MEKPISLNGAAVIARTKDAVYIRIPRAIASNINGGCGCTFCKAHPEQVAQWDTLCVSIKSPKNGNDYTWHVHMPDPQTFQAIMNRKEAA